MSDHDLPLPPSLGGVTVVPPTLNPFTGGLKFTGLKMGQLKKKEEKMAFIDYDLASFFNQTSINATERLRQIDKFHLHAPLDSECSLLNVPNNRLNLLILKDILYLSGGLVGTRFSNEDLASLRGILPTMTKLWIELEMQYKVLDTVSKKLLINDKPQETEETNETSSVRKFHALVDQYLEQLVELQAIVRRLQNSIDKSKEGIGKFDADPESKIGKKMPDWLSVLIAAYQRSVSDSQPTPTATAVTNKPFTVGKLAVFLSSYMGELRGTLGAAETDALSILLEASSDCQLSANPMQRLHRRYWGQRFFNFLSKLTELASTPKDEKALDAALGEL